MKNRAPVHGRRACPPCCGYSRFGLHARAIRTASLVRRVSAAMDELNLSVCLQRRLGKTESSTSRGSLRQWGKYSAARAPVTATRAVSALAGWNVHQRRAHLEEGSEEANNLPRVRRRQSTFQQASDLRAKSLLPWYWRRPAPRISHMIGITLASAGSSAVPGTIRCLPRVGDSRYIVKRNMHVPTRPPQKGSAAKPIAWIDRPRVDDQQPRSRWIQWQDGST